MSAKVPEGPPKGPKPTPPPPPPPVKREVQEVVHYYTAEDAHHFDGAYRKAQQKLRRIDEELNQILISYEMSYKLKERLMEIQDLADGYK